MEVFTRAFPKCEQWTKWHYNLFSYRAGGFHVYIYMLFRNMFFRDFVFRKMLFIYVYINVMYIQCIWKVVRGGGFYPCPWAYGLWMRTTTKWHSHRIFIENIRTSFFFSVGGTPIYIAYNSIHNLITSNESSFSYIFFFFLFIIIIFRQYLL